MSTLNLIVLIFGYVVLCLAMLRVCASAILDTIVVLLRVKRILTDKAMFWQYVSLIDEATPRKKEKP
jgi:hypothetical protein